MSDRPRMSATKRFTAGSNPRSSSRGGRRPLHIRLSSSVACSTNKTVFLRTSNSFSWDADIRFSNDEKAILVDKLKLYFDQELNQEIGQFDAEFLLDFIGEEMGAYFYNRGLQDAQAMLESRIESITDGFYELEKPAEFRR